jgi:hypothetical protein
MSEITAINRFHDEHSASHQPDAGQQKYLLGAMRYTAHCDQAVVMPDEDRELYHSHLQTLRDEYQPHGAAEEHLVQSLADLSWRQNRVVALESNLLSITYSPNDLVKGLLDQAKALTHLSLHSHRLSRQFKETTALLRELQKTRLDNLLDIMEVHEEKGETYRPSEDGFVFTDSQVATARMARKRARLLKKAAA